MPHLWLAGGWSEATATVTPEQQRHLGSVLRISPGTIVSYTDGSGVRGEGLWLGDVVERGAETIEPMPSRLTVAVAPPDSRDRQRWMIEKATELGAWRIRWLRTQYGQGRVPRPDKAQAWMTAALEQSRRTWATAVDDEWSTFADLGEFSAADAGGEAQMPESPATIAIGPEGGWAPEELDDTVPRVSLSRHILRTETAVLTAIVRFDR